jgi:catalase-peroxidase
MSMPITQPTTSRSRLLRRPMLLALAVAAACAAPQSHQPGQPADVSGGTCPVTGMSGKPDASANAAMRNTAAGAMSTDDWWPNQLNLRILHQNPPAGNPLGADFDYAAEFEKLDSTR